MMRIFLLKEAGNYTINDFVFGNSKSIWILSEVKGVGLKTDVPLQQFECKLKSSCLCSLGSWGVVVAKWRLKASPRLKPAVKEDSLLETNDRKQQILLDKLYYFIVLSNYRWNL